MFPSLRAGNNEELEFKWVKKKDVQLYESFTFDGLDYSLYDCVYLMEKGKPHPYIGKIIGIWENADKSKQINVQWFLRPSEISQYLGDAAVQENELFLASGHGVGLANINALEAIGGKCNVVCTSTDSRNPQPSPKELMMADYVFYRIFDVEKLQISDQIGDIVGELQVEYVFNRKDNKKNPINQNLDQNREYDAKNVTESEQAEKLASGKNLEQLESPGPDENCDQRIEKQFTHPKQQDQAGKASLLGEADEVSLMKELEPGEECSPGVDVHSVKDKGMCTIDKECTESAKSVGCQFNDEKDIGKAINSPAEQIRVKKTGTSVRVSNELKDTPSERSKLNGIGTSSQDSGRNIAQNSPLTVNDTTPNAQPKRLVICALSADAQPNVKLGKDQNLRSAVDVKLAKNFGSSNDKLSKTKFSISKRNLYSGCAGNGIENKVESNKNLETLGEGVDVEISNLGNAKNVGNQKDFSSAESSIRFGERSSIGNVSSPNEPSSSTCKKDFDEPGQATKFVKDSTSLTKKVSKKIDHSRGDSIAKLNNSHGKDNETLLEDVEERTPKRAKHEKLKTSSHDDEVNGKKYEEAGVTKARNPRIMSLDEDVVKERTQKKANCEGSKISRCDDKINGDKMKEISESKRKNLFITSNDNVKSSPLKKAKRLDEGPSKECSDKTCKAVDRSLYKLRVPMSNKVEGKTFEVTRRPSEKKCKWLGELPWEENMKSAYGEQRVVLFQNLDPRYTSRDVEDIIWHAFQEYGTARMVQPAAISTRNSGQAFFILKNQKAVRHIVEKLDTGCLMLPNNRPLVVTTEFDLQLPGSSRKKFVGHLSIDKVRRQEQMENKDAICTSHYAQDNTLEYDMAMEWILLYCKSDECWKRLCEQQRKERRKLAAHLKSR